MDALIRTGKVVAIIRQHPIDSRVGPVLSVKSVLYPPLQVYRGINRGYNTIMYVQWQCMGFNTV